MTLEDFLKILASVVGVAGFGVACVAAYARWISRTDRTSDRVEVVERRVNDLENRVSEKFREVSTQIAEVKTKQDEANKNAQLFQLSITKDVAEIGAGVRDIRSRS